MTTLAERVAARVAEKIEIPAWSKDKERIVYVLPETLESQPDKYERIPNDDHHRVEEHGKPRKPKKPKPARKPRKPEIPRAVTPAPVKPPESKKPVKPVPAVKPPKPVKPVKPPTPPKKPRRWKVDKPKVYHHKTAAERVVLRYLQEAEDE